MRLQLIVCTVAIALVAVLSVTRPEVLQQRIDERVWVDSDTGCRYWRRTGGPIMRSDGLADCGQPRKAVSP
ncbi:MAG: hypothetical protein B7Z40_08555 [Bosea sp. 12-68-7]|nr:MAG: hypothetical protein B7Z40_08555 [Bosea sp. 12-68-7]